MSTSTITRPALRGLLKSNGTSHILPAFLLPSLLSLQQTSSFSSTTINRFPRDNNRQRGVSTTKRSGLRQPLSVSKTPLPEPVRDPAKRSKPVVDENHGLWEFFHSKTKPMNTPSEDGEYGRPWTVEELRAKSWEDLHSLWWVCCKERNRIATEDYERRRLEAGYGDAESAQRDRAVRRTQRAIKQVLTERYYSWKEAEIIAKEDPEIQISEEGIFYTPSHFDENVVEEAEVPSEEFEPSADQTIDSKLLGEKVKPGRKHSPQA